MDHEFQAVTSANFNPLVRTKSQVDSYAATRWHEKKNGQMYGYANMSWVDGHASKEPTDLGQMSKAGVRPRYCYYLWNH
jgi:prepilin-type processing-associated H-X9-DG protein